MLPDLTFLMILQNFYGQPQKRAGELCWQDVNTSIEIIYNHTVLYK